MNNRYKIYAASLLFCCSLSVSAQNLNPRVEVTNAYEGKMVDTYKEDVPMNVPDSLLVFDYDFDYSVFDNPYKGAYEFTPYLINMKPEMRQYTGKQFYLRAGAGYTMRPEAEIIYSGKAGKYFNFSVYDNFTGYFGRYNFIQGYPLSAGGYLIDNFNRQSGFYKGWEMQNRVGASGHLEYGNFVMSFDVAHRLMAATDTTYSHFYQAADLNLELGTKEPTLHGFTYSAGVHAVFGEDKVDYEEGLYSVGDTEVEAKATIGKRIGRASGFELLGSFAMAKYSNIINSNVMNAYALPRYTFNGNRVRFSAGLKVSALFGSDFTKSVFGKMHTKKSALCYPDASLSVRILNDGLTMYAKITGGDRINAYSSILERNHFYNIVSQVKLQNAQYNAYKVEEYLEAIPPMDNTVEKFNVSGGIRGQILQHLEYDLSAGYFDSDNVLMDGLCVPSGVNLIMDALFFPGTVVGTSVVNPTYITYYEDLKMFYADAFLNWKSSRFDLNAHLRYNKPTLGTSKELSRSYSLPSPRFKGEFSAKYNWSKRIYIGAYGEYCSERVGFAVIPQYFNLGATMEFVLNNRISFWVKGDNLLNNRIQRYLLHAEDGIGVTAGICLNL